MPSGSCVKNLNSSYRVFCLMFKSLRKMNTQTKTLVIFRDCHAAHRIAVRCTDTMDERFVRRFAQRMGWPVAERKGGEL